jgi:RNA polymerase sigma factor (sigma-70 family)
MQSHHVSSREKYPYVSDELVWRDMKTGNRLAFTYIYNQYAEDLLKYGVQICGDKDLTQDVVHDIFTNLWIKRESLPVVHSIRFYLISALRRSILRADKKKHQHTFDIDQTSFSMVPSFLDENFRNEAENEISAKIQEVIASLSKRQREIIYLRFYQNLSYLQIAEILELDQKYTYNLASRAFQSFKEKFSGFITPLLILFTVVTDIL